MMGAPSAAAFIWLLGEMINDADAELQRLQNCKDKLEHRIAVRTARRKDLAKQLALASSERARKERQKKKTKKFNCHPLQTAGDTAGN